MAWIRTQDTGHMSLTCDLHVRDPGLGTLNSPPPETFQKRQEPLSSGLIILGKGCTWPGLRCASHPRLELELGSGTGTRHWYKPLPQSGTAHRSISKDGECTTCVYCGGPALMAAALPRCHASLGALSTLTDVRTPFPKGEAGLRVGRRGGRNSECLERSCDLTGARQALSCPLPM